MTRTTGAALAAAALLALANPGARADWLIDSVEMPVERVIGNLEGQLETEPGDWRSRLSLARAHAYAATVGFTTLRVMRDDLRPSPWQRSEATPDEPQPLGPWQRAEEATLSEAERLAHLEAAIGQFQRLSGERPREPSVALAFAVIAEHAAERAMDVASLPVAFEPGPRLFEPDDEAVAAYRDTLIDPERQRILTERGFLWLTGPSRAGLAASLRVLQRDADPVVAETSRNLLRRLWLELAADLYFRALSSSLPDVADLYRFRSPAEPLIGPEAAAGFLRVDGLLPPSDGRQRERAIVETAKRELARIPPGPVTPIVFTLDRARPLADLIDAGARAAFDLDGTGRDLRWDWPRPGTGILVWDPRRTGRVTSGRQLFGSVTWWLMPADGYAAMAMLDDDGDGELAGGELAGLAVWFDDGDGESEPGEVVPIDTLPIAALATRATAHDGAAPMHPEGLRLRDGRRLPTYDWIATPVNETSGDDA